MSPLHLWTFVTGEDYIESRFKKTICRSLSWAQNKQALASRRTVWQIWGLRKEFPFIADAAKDVGVDIRLNEADQFVADLHSKYLGDNGVMMREMFLISARECLNVSAQMLMAPPDTLFGGDAIANIIQAGEQPGVVVGVPHIRVLPSMLDAIEQQANRFGPTSSISNPRLAAMAVRHAHRSFTEAEYGGERINSFIGGIFWKRRPNGIIAMQHRLWTPYLINWTQTDYDFFSRQNPKGEWPPVYGEIDHLYPGVCVFPQERARVLGSSDDAFICEITEAESNVPPLQPYNKSQPDLFWREMTHNKINGQFIFTIRGEE